MPDIDFLRHGTTERPTAMNGRTDVGLSPEGWDELRRQVEGRVWTSIVASPLQRASGPANEIATKLGIPIEIDPDWREIDFGDWDGREIAELRADPEAAKGLGAFYADPTSLAPPNGESYAALEERVRRAVTNLAQKDGHVLVIAHAGSIRTALSLVLDLPLAKLWSIRIEYATRVRARIGHDPVHGLWGQMTELAQP